MEIINNLRKKILQSYLENNLDVPFIVEEFCLDLFTMDEKEYIDKKMILKIEDITEKEKAIAGVLKLLGEENMEINFEDSEERRDRIKLLGQILIFIQE